MIQAMIKIWHRYHNIYVVRKVNNTVAVVLVILFP